MSREHWIRRIWRTDCNQFVTIKVEEWDVSCAAGSWGLKLGPHGFMAFQTAAAQDVIRCLGVEGYDFFFNLKSSQNGPDIWRVYIYIDTYKKYKLISSFNMAQDFQENYMCDVARWREQGVMMSPRRHPRWIHPATTERRLPWWRCFESCESHQAELQKLVEGTRAVIRGRTAR